MGVIDPAMLALLPGYIGLGITAGFLAGLLGIGGGTILVPGLYYLLSLAGPDVGNQDRVMHTALATSMAIIFPTGLSSSWAQIKRKAVAWDAIRLMAPGLMVGVIAGVILVSHLDSAILKVVFAIGLYGIAASIVFRSEAVGSMPALREAKWAAPFSIVFGIAATVWGMGGAVLNVPYLTRAGWPLKTTIASASVLGVMVSLPAIIGYIAMGKGGLGYIDAMAFLMIVPMSVLIAPLGVRASHALPVGKLKIIFALLLVCVATKMVFEII